MQAKAKHTESGQGLRSFTDSPVELALIHKRFHG